MKNTSRFSCSAIRTSLTCSGSIAYQLLEKARLPEYSAQMPEAKEVEFRCRDEAWGLCDVKLTQGCRIWWYHKEDLEIAKEHGFDARAEAPYSGIAVCKPDSVIPSGKNRLSVENCIVIMDTYPVQKCNCEATYITMDRLLDTEGLVEVFCK